MSAFVLSQILAGVAICFDLLSFQFKERRRIIVCLIAACLLLAIHFALLERWTATGLGLLAAVRFVAGYLTTSRRVMALFCVATVLVAAVTFQGPLSLLAGLGSLFGTVATFCRDDRRLRQLLLVGTSLWLTHNILAATPAGVLLESLFIGSNLVGYYRFYGRPAAQPIPPVPADRRTPRS